MVESLKHFLIGSSVPPEQIEFIINSVQEIKGQSYMSGYKDAVRARRRRDELKNRRIKNSVKRFLDYIHDITHG